MPAPPGTVWIRLDDGYRPHFKASFVERYGPDSVFVAAVADCLTARHVRLMIRAGRLEEGTPALQLGSAEACAAIENLLRALQARGVDGPIVLLLRSAMSEGEDGAFQARSEAEFGESGFRHWLGCLERREFAAAAGFLAPN